LKPAIFFGENFQFTGTRKFSDFHNPDDHDFNYKTAWIAAFSDLKKTIFEKSTPAAGGKFWAFQSFLTQFSSRK
jgi:hypothetical protein